MILKDGISIVSIYCKNFFSLIYPHTCCACGNVLMADEEHICMYCRLLLPKTRFHRHRENQLTKIFWGRQPIETGTSLYYFHKGGKVQRLIHQFKYRGNISLGIYLGAMLGRDIASSAMYEGINYVLPVPLHPKKERKRGFNQSEVIARGIASSTSALCSKELLIRKHETATQTRKSRFNRWENVSDVFETPEPAALEGKGILLVDDVITTGSTLEACIQKLLAIKGVKVWIATLAITD